MNVETLNRETVAELAKNGNDPKWLSELRAGAIGQFENMKWPLPDLEEWRRTNLESFNFESYPFARSILDGNTPSVKSGAGRIRFEGSRLTEYSIPKELEAKGGFLLRYPAANVAELERLNASEPVLQALSKSAESLDNRLMAWNLSAWSAGAILYVPDGVVLEEPVFIEYMDPENDSHVQTHTVVVLGVKAEATVVQRHSGGGNTLWNGGLTAVVGDASTLNMISRQDVSIGSTYFQNARTYVARDATLNGFEMITGGKLTKTRNEVYIDGAGAQANIDGIYITRKDQHMDLRTVQYHRAPHGESRAFYKGAVAQGGRSVYQGMIDVEHGADGTDAYLTNNNLLLGDGARADSIPCLEIRTNDVKCSHGSTSGKINKDELFYLMSRGIQRETAIQDLIAGYFEAVIKKVPEKIRDDIRGFVEKIIKDEGDTWLVG